MDRYNDMPLQAKALTCKVVCIPQVEEKAVYAREGVLRTICN